MPPLNNALLLPAPKAPTCTIGSAPYVPPSHGELVIKTHAVAINPADWGIQRLGILIPDSAYPCILGCDVAGEVVELPPGEPGDLIAKFKLGGRGIAQTGPLSTKDSKDLDLSAEGLQIWEGKKVYATAAFQTYVVLHGPLLA